MAEVVYAGAHGGCMPCDSTAEDLQLNGHRPRCYSQYANEPPLPPADRAALLRAKAEGLIETAAELRKQADALDSTRLIIPQLKKET